MFTSSASGSTTSLLTENSSVLFSSTDWVSFPERGWVIFTLAVAMVRMVPEKNMHTATSAATAMSPLIAIFLAFIKHNPLGFVISVR